jgi:GT2 family glycosyltransferase
MPDAATVSAVLVDYDGPAQGLAAAAASLRNQTLAPAQILCVDQSVDGRFQRSLSGDERVEVIRSGRNLGYSSACNLAARAAHGEYLLFLNSDAEADPDCVEQLVDALARRPDAAVAGAQVLLPGRQQVNAGDNALHITGLSWAGRYGLAPEHGQPRSAAVVSGAALLVRRSAFLALEGYTEGFFMYYDDVDLAWRAHLMGWQVLFCPSANVVHEYEFVKGGYKWRYLERNRWWCLLAHLEARTLVALAPLLLAVEAAILARAAREGWLVAKLDGYRLLWSDRGALWARRREVQRSRRVGDGPILAQMTGRVDSPFLASVAIRRAGPLLTIYHRLLCRLVGDGRPPHGLPSPAAADDAVSSGAAAPGSTAGTS